MKKTQKTCLESPAKINLSLKIVGKTENGFHELNSLVTKIDLYDEIEIVPSNELKIEFSGLDAHDIPNDNTASKAINLLNKAIAENDVKSKITDSIKIHKNIPNQAGLGGGSSNAATLIRYYGDQYNLPLSTQFNIAAQIGADVSLFLKDEAHFMGGLGEITLQQVTLPEFYILLITPVQGNSTKEVFDKFQFEANTQKIRTPADWKDLKELSAYLNKQGNDLLKPANQVNSEIDPLLRTLKLNKNCLYANMSGSGSSCFAIFENEDDAEKALRSFKQNSKQKHQFTKIVKPI